MKSMYDLNRFLVAQDSPDPPYSDYPTALQEIRNGRKTSHWIWYVFPQISGLGSSDMCLRYSIADRGEAVAYMRNEVLHRRLVEISRALLESGEDDPSVVLGNPDDLKVQSCMTLFSTVCPEESVFSEVLDRMYAGKRDPKTLELLDAGH